MEQVSMFVLGFRGKAKITKREKFLREWTK